jgi:putative nucleotidyltransferase with HDIG domain
MAHPTSSSPARHPAPGRQLTEELSPPQTTCERHLETLLQVIRAIGGTLDAPVLFQRVMQHLTAAFGADRSSLFLHDPRRGELVSCVAQGLEGEGLRLPDHAGLCGHVFHSREPLLIEDALADDRFDREVSRRTRYTPRAMLLAPLAPRPGPAIGVMQVMDQRPGHFRPDDLSLLEAIAVPVGITCENARLYLAQRRQFSSFVRAFSAALDARDPCTQIHSINVANYAVGMAISMGLDRSVQEWLRVAGLLHDVGKIGTPESILTKPGRLSEAEFEEMKRHAAHSRRILAEIDFTDAYAGMAWIAAAHHEKLDGSGYPDGLRGAEIPLEARILCVADIYDALTQKRHYREGMSHERALEVIDGMTPAQLDPACVAALRSFLGAGIEAPPPNPAAG